MTATCTEADGTLRIGDEWNAISIIACSQTHPLKAVCELVENAIDAKARTISITRRKRSNGDILLEVADDGRGVALDAQGRPNFAHLATHICDSMKRRLSVRERTGVHGEFGIGLLSFWTLGEELRMTSSDRDGQPHEFRMRRGDPRYLIAPGGESLGFGGVSITIGPLLEATQKIVTGEKLQRYLAAELRDRIRATGVTIQITDRIARKELVVVPREFQGERLTELRELRTPFGRISFDLYVRPAADYQTARVAVAKDGTRVLQSITEIIHFDRPPWTDGRLEGVIDFPALTLAAGTRQGVVPDDRLEAFLAAVRDQEPLLATAIAARDQAETVLANRQILKQVKHAFLGALRELEDQYLYFDVPQTSRRRPRASANADPRQRSLPGLTADEDGAPARAGQIASVVITPRNARRPPQFECILVAQAYDTAETPIDWATYAWSIAAGKGRIVAVDNNRCRVTARKPGRIVVEVRAAKGIREVQDRVPITFLAQDDDDLGSARGLPSYRLQAAPGESWRSRYQVKTNEIVINSAHRDFLASRAASAKHRRYIGKLYAKEVVLINFPHESSGEIMERLIEVIVRTEDSL